MKNKKFDHSQLIETLSNIDINNHHSIRIILENLNNGEELIGTPFDKKDTFHLDPITNDIGMQFKMLDRNLEYEKIFEANDEQGKDWTVEYGLLSSKKNDESFLTCIHSIGGDYWDVILRKFNKIHTDEKSKLSNFILNHFEKDTYAVKYNYSENVYLSKGYNWDLDHLYNLLNKILKEKQKTFPKDHIAVWKHRPNQKRLTYERINYLS